MKVDGGLRPMFRDKLARIHWTSIETLTVNGVPDAEFCFEGSQGWIEYKFTDANYVKIRPEQVGWHLRRARARGRSLFAVRKTSRGGPRSEPCDDLYLFRGADAVTLRDHGLTPGGPSPLGHWTGGPARWDWDRVSDVLLTGDLSRPGSSR
jgi:hypothetical protein